MWRRLWNTKELLLTLAAIVVFWIVIVDPEAFMRSSETVSRWTMLPDASSLNRILPNEVSMSKHWWGAMPENAKVVPVVTLSPEMALAP